MARLLPYSPDGPGRALAEYSDMGDALPAVALTQFRTWVAHTPGSVDTNVVDALGGRCAARHYLGAGGFMSTRQQHSCERGSELT
jgi:hypothetical protein